jgi:hypothetical protein
MPIRGNRSRTTNRGNIPAHPPTHSTGLLAAQTPCPTNNSRQPSTTFASSHNPRPSDYDSPSSRSSQQAFVSSSAPLAHANPVRTFEDSQYLETRGNQQSFLSSNALPNSVETLQDPQYLERSNDNSQVGAPSSVGSNGTSSITPGDSISNISSSGPGEKEREVLEVTKDVCERICLFEAPFKKGYNRSTTMEADIWREATALCGETLIRPPSKAAKLELRKNMTAARSRLVYQCKIVICKKFKDLPTAEIIQKTEYLLDKDRYICHPDGAEKHNMRFLNPLLIEIIYDQFFRGPKMKGRTDPTFIENINSVLICLTATAVHHQLEAFINGTYEPTQQFREKSVGRHFQRHTATWIGLGEELQALHIAFYKSEIKKMMRRSGHIMEEISVEGYVETDTRESILFLQNQLRANEQEAISAAMYRHNRRQILLQSANHNTLEEEIDQEPVDHEPVDQEPVGRESVDREPQEG